MGLAMKKIVKAYWSVLAGLRLRTTVAVIISGLSGMLEGTAFLFLVPILGQGISKTQSGDYGPLPRMIGSIIQNFDRGKISLFLCFILAALLSALLKLIADGLMLTIRNRIEQNIRRDVGMALFHVDWPNFLSLKIGEIGKSVLTEATTAADGCHTMLSMLGQCLISIFLIIVSFMISVPMTLVTFLFGGLTAAVYYVGGRRAVQHAKNWFDSTSSIADRIGELFNHLKFIRGSGFTPSAIKQTQRAYQDYSNSYFKSVYYRSLLRFFLECTAAFVMAAFLAYGFFWSGEQPEWIIVFLAVFYRLMPRLNAIQEGFYTATIYSVWLIKAQERIELLRKFRMRETHGQQLTTVSTFEAKRLAYHYPNHSRIIFSNIQFSLQKDKLLLLLGDSGSGKSTLLDLILGLLEPTEGQLLIDGEPLTEFDTESWRSRIGLVLQGSPIFHGTVLENITFFSDSVDEKKAWACAEKADAAAYIRDLPQGMNTPIGEKGGRLSGGQRQRLALARALYRDPWLLIMDEPTSELDEDSQMRVIETLKSLKPHYAMIMSSHRPEAMAIADSILHLPSGRLQDNP